MRADTKNGRSSANRIGYCARTCGLSWDDLLTDPDTRRILLDSGIDGRMGFEAGWAEADVELLAERIAEMKARLSG